MSQSQPKEQRELELRDIQGNVVRAYGRFNYPFARYFFLNVPLHPKTEKGERISQQEAARQFVDRVRLKVTSATRWPRDEHGNHNGPQVTLNIGFSFPGLMALGLPVKTLSALPSEFIDGMKNRASILGDRDPAKMAHEDPDWNQHWDELWQNSREPEGDPDKNVHIWISMNAKVLEKGKAEPCRELGEQTEWLQNICHELGINILSGTGRARGFYQEANAVFREFDGGMYPTPYEHFGLTDGIGDPVFKGQYPTDEMPDKVIGRGKLMNADTGWEALETGEFILGYPDESQELPPTPPPAHIFYNGSFMVYRKLHENVASFEAVIDREAKKYAETQQLATGNEMDREEARETLVGKMVGRWRNGVPLAVAPTYKAMLAYAKAEKLDDPDTYAKYLRGSKILDFRYADDMEGQRCPVASHLRRTNTRDTLDPLNKPNDKNEQGERNNNDNSTTALNKRRRILRRGLPYGPAQPVTDNQGNKVLKDENEQGVIFMTIGSSIFRQFEFIQQQWIQYGLDFNAGNTTCPLLGRHDHNDTYVVPASEPDTEGTNKGEKQRTFVMSGLKNFVECRGGDYFFLPSMTALAAFAMGNVDPT